MADYVDDVLTMAAANAGEGEEEPYNGTDLDPIVKWDNGTDDYFRNNPHNPVYLRIAVVEDPATVRQSLINVDCTEVESAVNVSNGKVCLRWVGMSGGVCNPGEPASAPGPRTAYNPEDRDETEMASPSYRQTTELSYPFIWAGPSGNWCGVNFLPPIGTKVIVGFQKNGVPTILGYLNPKYKNCKPYVLPGETCIKGYGNNYAFFRQSNKLDLHAWSSKGDQDRDDKDGVKGAGADCDVWVRLDADNGQLILSAGSSAIVIEDAGITIIAAKKSAINLTEDKVVLNTSTFVNSAQAINQNAGAINNNG